MSPGCFSGFKATDCRQGTAFPESQFTQLRTKDRYMIHSHTTFIIANRGQVNQILCWLNCFFLLLFPQFYLFVYLQHLSNCLPHIFSVFQWYLHNWPRKTSGKNSFKRHPWSPSTWVTDMTCRMIKHVFLWNSILFWLLCSCQVNVTKTTIDTDELAIQDDFGRSSIDQRSHLMM